MVITIYKAKIILMMMEGNVLPVLSLLCFLNFLKALWLENVINSYNFLLSKHDTDDDGR
jgi:hypothetical protein